MSTFNTGAKSEEGTFKNLVEISQGNSVITDGPLSKMYTNALNVIYAKEVDEETGISIESQAMDASAHQSMWLATKADSDDFSNHSNDIGMLYGVKKYKAKITDVINVADAFSEMTSEQKANSGIIIDAKIEQPNDGTSVVQVIGYVNPFEASLESLCAEYGVKVYDSLEAYLKQHKKD